MSCWSDFFGVCEGTFWCCKICFLVLLVIFWCRSKWFSDVKSHIFAFSGLQRPTPQPWRQRLIGLFKRQVPFVTSFSIACTVAEIEASWCIVKAIFWCQKSFTLKNNIWCIDKAVFCCAESHLSMLNKWLGVLLKAFFGVVEVIFFVMRE